MIFPLFIPVRAIPGMEIHLESFRFSGESGEYAGPPGEWDTQLCTDKPALEGTRQRLMTFASFCGINIPSLADVKLPKVNSAQKNHEHLPTISHQLIQFGSSLPMAQTKSPERIKTVT